MSEEKKWACDYCTYENWPSAIKCTLCRGPKPPQLIASDALLQEKDIYNLAPLISQKPDNGNGVQNILNLEQPSNPYSKWSCHACTYLNWPRATRCSQCLVVRKKGSPTSVSTSREHISISGDGGCLLSDNGSSGGSSPKSFTRKSSPVSPAAAKEIVKDVQNDQNQSMLGSVPLVKWMCMACTYENWPKALSCVLCRTQRLLTVADHNVGRSVSPVEDPNLSSAACNKPSKSPSPLSEDNRSMLDGSSCTENNNNRSASQNCGCGSGTTENESVAGASAASNNYQQERRLKQLRRCIREADWPWLNACLGVVDDDASAIQSYLSSGGDPSRQLSQNEVALLNRPSAFNAGYTLVHLAIRFQREDLLRILLSSDVGNDALKRVPSHVSPDLAADIRRHITASLLQRKGDFPCIFVTELVTFALPAEIDDLRPSIQERLYDELLDRDVQKELEVESPIINWSLELTERLGSRLYPLWNRTAGDCLLDSVLQATWGVFDKENTLRRALSNSLSEGAATFYPRWKESEAMQAHLLHFSLDEAQWQQDWAILLSLAGQPGAPLEQMHVFALAHILRRPIIVYGVKYVKGFRGEAIGFARFEGVYLPLLWEQSFCWKTPIALGYTRGHFSALVPMEPDTSDDLGAGANIHGSEDLQVTFLPLMTSDGKLLPVHFLNNLELGHDEHILRQWMDCCVTEGGVLVAQQKIQKRPLLVAQMVEEWLNYYRRLSPVQGSALRSPTTASTHTNNPGYSSDGDSDDE